MAIVEAENGYRTTINAEEAAAHLTMCFQSQLTPFLKGSPGIGKSDIYKQIAKRFQLKLIDVRLSQCDPTDLAGFPFLNGDKASYKPMDTFPLESDPIPAGYKGWLILLDEINSAALAVQAASYKLTLDRMVGCHRLHPQAVIGCAGNLLTDNAIVNRIGTAMQSRLVHLTLRVDPKLWSLWASSNHLAPEVISYINHQPGNLHVFDPNHTGDTFACPRTWEFASKVVKYNKGTLKEKLPALVGCIGESIGFEFVTYCDVYKHIPTYSDIKASPRTINVTAEPMMLAAISGMVAANLNEKDLPTIMPYIHRLPMEFQVFTLRDALKRTPILKKSQDIMDWVNVHADALA